LRKRYFSFNQNYIFLFFFSLLFNVEKYKKIIN
jgi:hypothetical protein